MSGEDLSSDSQRKILKMRLFIVTSHDVGGRELFSVSSIREVVIPRVPLMISLLSEGPTPTHLPSGD